MDEDIQLPRVLEVREVARSPWLAFQELIWKDRKGVQRNWQRTSRVTPADRRGLAEKNLFYVRGPVELGTPPEDFSKKAFERLKNHHDTADAAAVIALCYHGGGGKERAQKSTVEPKLSLIERPDVEVVLVKQFRPPVDAFSIEFPAGLVDENETGTASAIREMKEETGYTITKILHASPKLYLSPGETEETMMSVVAAVDLDSEENRQPMQQLEGGEDIEVFRVPLRELSNRLREFRAEGCVIFDEVYYFALGLNSAKWTLDAAFD